MGKVVLDASALLALVNEEPGADTVLAAVPDSVMSAVNLAEVIAKLTDYGLVEDETRDVLVAFALDIAPFDEALAFLAGHLYGPTRRLGLSLGDRACLALARKMGLPALTADRTWSKLDIGVDVQVIR